VPILVSKCNLHNFSNKFNAQISFLKVCASEIALDFRGHVIMGNELDYKR
jgi:hypothetical protein